MADKYSTYILEFIRNNEMPQENCIDANKFIMLDYFDVLYCKELTGDEKTYMNYFFVKDIFKGDMQSKVSYKTLSLYQHDGKIEESPFDVLNGEEKYLSEIPFLGVIQICLCKETYKNDILCFGNVDGFLSAMEEEIFQAAKSVISEYNTRKIVMQIYRGSTTADFCLVMRTNDIKDVYKVASRLNNSRRNSTDSFKVVTYTNIGIECREKNFRDKSQKEYCTFSPSFLNSYGNDTMAIRFSADSHVSPTAAYFPGAHLCLVALARSELWLTLQVNVSGCK